MNYIFVFLGEFGYELLNWQGVIRKFSKTIDRTKDNITVCTRAGLEPFYEFADRYITISELPLYKNSAANMYWAHNPECNFYKRNKETLEKGLDWELMSKKDLKYQKRMKKEIMKFVFEKLDTSFFDKYIFKKYKFIFSSDYQTLNGLTFGTKNMNEAKIYSDLDLDNNEFVKTSACKEARQVVEDKLGFNLSDDYVLCQTGARKVVRRSKESATLDILKEIALKIKVVLLDFDTKRNLDSKSEFENIENCYRYSCSSFKEQSVLIENSKYCLFFTEGDFRSHNYLPPLMGKNVYSVAPKTVFKLGTTPIDFWNSNVFRFGGQIVPIFAEELENRKDLFIREL